MYWERFAVFDVETPNSANNRMSAIGVTIVSQGQIVQHLETLIDPETHFDPFNVQLTGIRRRRCRVSPPFLYCGICWNRCSTTAFWWHTTPPLI